VQSRKSARGCAAHDHVRKVLIEFHNLWRGAVGSSGPPQARDYWHAAPPIRAGTRESLAAGISANFCPCC
jgi:hypothetical protein